MASLVQGDPGNSNEAPAPPVPPADDFVTVFFFLFSVECANQSCVHFFFQKLVEFVHEGPVVGTKFEGFTPPLKFTMTSAHWNLFEEYLVQFFVSI